MKANSQTVLTAAATGGSIILKHPRWADFDQWVTLRRENREFLSPWEPQWDSRHLTRMAYRARLARFKKMVANGEAFPFHLFHNDDSCLIGACNITHIERSVSQSARIGYWIGEQYGRKGYARLSVDAACRFSFEALGLHRLEAAVRPDNVASIKVLEAVGFKAEGVLRGYLKINGTWQDHQLYAKLASD